MADPILVWQFEDAPEEFRKLSTNGGDEDWLAVLPADYDHPCGDPYWTEGNGFGCAGTERHELPDGRVVLIGSHA